MFYFQKYCRAEVVLVIFITQAILSCIFLSTLNNPAWSTIRVRSENDDLSRFKLQVTAYSKLKARSSYNLIYQDDSEQVHMCNKTIHSWSRDLLIEHHISCGLVTIQNLAEEIITKSNDSTRRARLNYLEGFHEKLQRLHSMFEGARLRNETLQRINDFQEELKRRWNSRAAVAIKKLHGYLKGGAFNNWEEAFIRGSSGHRSNKGPNILSEIYELKTPSQSNDTYRTKQFPSLISSAYVNQNARSLAFIKPYKVGSTVVASLLTMRAYLYNLEMGTLPEWSQHSLLKHEYRRERCIDILGTGHPQQNYYARLHNASSAVTQHQDTYFCRNVTEFMLIRNPIDRLWSGYQHARRYNPTLPLQLYLQNKKLNLSVPLHHTAQAPHTKLSENVTQALLLSEKLLMLVSDSTEMMDKSLILLSIKAVLSICDVMYEPCSPTQDWSTSKCDHAQTRISSTQRQLLKDHMITSGESEFYEAIFKRYQNMISNDSVLNKRLAFYRYIRRKALDRCKQKTPGYLYADIFLMLDRRVMQITEDGKRRWVLKGEDLHSLEPTWLCMQWFCNKQNTWIAP